MDKAWTTPSAAAWLFGGGREKARLSPATPCAMRCGAVGADRGPGDPNIALFDWRCPPATTSDRPD
ncbi:MAG: hypothetical protein OXH15_22765, partial [Gammaproteobacteria bacterium]|nr:hypothetical protein [Gammaproteobacteria bacterium]